MSLSYKPRRLLAVFLASLAVWPCLAVPTSPPATPGNTVAVHPPSAPSKDGRKAPIELTQFIAKWMRKRETEFRAMPSSTGGTEAWIQFGFEVATKERQGLDVEVKIDVRERRIYTNNALAADWVFPSTNTHKGLIVELKVESGSQTGGGLATKVVADQQKISGQVKDEFKDYDRAVYAIAWSPSTIKALKEVDMLEVEGSTIPLKKKRENIITLLVWDPPETKNAPSTGNPLAPGPNAPSKQTLPFHPKPGSNRTPSPPESGPSSPHTPDTPTKGN